MNIKTLLLLRHAKSSRDDPAMRDFDRPLAPRGRRVAPLIGVHIEQTSLIPDFVLCSAAVRARETLAHMARQWPDQPPTQYESDIYAAGPQACLTRIRELDDALASAMIVGHNPCLEDLAAMLVADGEKAALKQLRKAFPTGALAVIRFDVGHWRDAGPGLGRLTDFVRPKSLV